MIELKDSSGEPAQGMLVKNNNNGRAQRFVILILASKCIFEKILYILRFFKFFIKTFFLIILKFSIF